MREKGGARGRALSISCVIYALVFVFFIFMIM